MRNVAQETRKCSKAEDVNERFQLNCGSQSLVMTCCFQTIFLLMKIITGVEEYPVALIQYILKAVSVLFNINAFSLFQTLIIVIKSCRIAVVIIIVLGLR